MVASHVGARLKLGPPSGCAWMVITKLSPSNAAFKKVSHSGTSFQNRIIWLCLRIGGTHEWMCSFGFPLNPKQGTLQYDTFAWCLKIPMRRKFGFCGILFWNALVFSSHGGAPNPNQHWLLCYQKSTLKDPQVPLQPCGLLSLPTNQTLSRTLIPLSLTPQ